MRVPKSFSLDLEIVNEIDKRAKGDPATFLNQFFREHLFSPTTPEDATKAEDLTKKRQTFIEDFKATSKSEEKATGLMLAAIKDGLFSNQAEFRRALKNA